MNRSYTELLRVHTEAHRVWIVQFKSRCYLLLDEFANKFAKFNLQQIIKHNSVVFVLCKRLLLNVKLSGTLCITR